MTLGRVDQELWIIILLLCDEKVKRKTLWPKSDFFYKSVEALRHRPTSAMIMMNVIDLWTRNLDRNVH